MSKIKLITENTDIKSLQMRRYDWDVVVNDIPYQVVKIPGYVHRIGGRWGDNDLWMYPRNEKPNYENLIEYDGDGCVCWGIVYNPRHYTKTKYDETECLKSGGAMITRNGEDFYFCRGGIDEARYRINKLADHPLELNFYNFDKRLIGRKVWWRSEPGIITGWVKGQACVIIEPDTTLIEKFSIPAEFMDDDMMEDESDIKADIFDTHIWWFR